MKYSYQRVSTVDKQSLLRQEKFARDNNVPRENWFQEKASGAKDNRVELNKLLRLLKENDELYVIDAAREKNGGINPGGRPRITKETLPDSFYRYLHMYQNGSINKSEFSKLNGLSRKSIYKYLSIISS